MKIEEIDDRLLFDEINYCIHDLNQFKCLNNTFFSVFKNIVFKPKTLKPALSLFLPPDE